MFQRIWQWLKQLWRRWVARQPLPAPTRQPPSDAESESVFMELLQEVASGSTRGEIQGFLIIQQGKKHVTEADLVAWLRRASSSWLASPAQHQELGRRMARLGDIYKGEIAEVARDISRKLVVENKPSVQYPSNHTSTTLTNTPSIPSNPKSTTPTNNPSVTHPPTINPEAATLYNQGVDLAYAGKVLGALALFERALAIDSNNHIIWNGLGNALYDLQRYKEAIAAYERAVAIDPNSHLAWNGLGNALRGVQRYDEAIKKFDRALQITKDQYWTAWANRGWAFFESNRYHLAIQNWDDGISKYLPANRDWKVAQGRLHQQKGRAQYLHGRQTTPSLPYFREAKTSFQKALEFLNQPNELRLEVLQEAIPVFRALNDTAASEYLNQGIEILQDLISAASSPTDKLRLERQFSSFYQLEVDNLVQSGDFPLALTKAEKRKNYCLRWLRQGWIENLEDSPTCEQIHQLLNPGTAIIYWHISPAAITTFILIPDCPLQAKIFADDLTSTGAADKELYKFETWIEEWKTDYQNYCEIQSKDDTEKPPKENHPWRVKMPDRLNQLAEILHIPQILTALGDNITQLILIPHRDLHLLPLESLFSQPAITRLPSAQIGIQQLSQTPPPSNSLLLIAQSQGKSNLKFPAIEAAAISQIYPCRRPPSSASKSATIQELQATDGIFHFTGHAQHNTANPAASALILDNGAEITLLDIFGLDFPSYYLVCLSGCETGIAGKLGLIDEFVSLASGFLPRTTYVISTLWRVDDRSSALLTIYFYLLCQKNPTPPAALEQSKAWLRTLTNGKLAQWYEGDLLPLLQQNDGDSTIVNFVTRESKRLQRNFAKIDDKPYEHPYHWAGFTIAGQE